MLRIIWIQIKAMTKQWTTLVSFAAMMLLALANCVHNIIQFRGTDIVDMMSPALLSVLSLSGSSGSDGMYFLLVQIYPVLVALAAGLNLAKEKKNGTGVYIISRTGKSNYLVSKLAAVFLVTAAVFTVPFLTELFINIVSFSLKARGGAFPGNYYDRQTISIIKEYRFPGLFIAHPIIHAILMIILFGLLSGILGAVTAAFSELLSSRYMVLYMLPVVAVLNLSFLFDGVSGIPMSGRWYSFYTLHTYVFKAWSVFFTEETVFLLFILLTAVFKKDSDTI